MLSDRSGMEKRRSRRPCLEPLASCGVAWRKTLLHALSAVCPHTVARASGLADGLAHMFRSDKARAGFGKNVSFLSRRTPLLSRKPPRRVQFSKVCRVWCCAGPLWRTSCLPLSRAGRPAHAGWNVCAAVGISVSLWSTSLFQVGGATAEA